MTIAGLFGDAELFAAISTDWDRYLRATHPGAIRYFKLREACSLTGEFNYWREDNRDAKVRQLAKVIDREDLLVISARLDLAAFSAVSQAWTHVKPRRGDLVRHHSMAEPYMLLCQGVLAMSVAEAVARGETTPIEIFFDDQDMLRQSILASYPGWREQEREYPARFAVMPVQPWFRDDKTWVILQAADLIAGDMRLGAFPADERPAFSEGLFSRLRMSGHCADIDAAEMAAMHQHLVESLEREERESQSD